MFMVTLAQLILGGFARLGGHGVDRWHGSFSLLE
jgi:hypothetical protein